MELKINADCFVECGASAAIVLAYIQHNSINGVMQCDIKTLAKQMSFTKQWVGRAIDRLAYYEYIEVELCQCADGLYRKKVMLGRKARE